MTHREMHAELYRLIRTNPSTQRFRKKHGAWLRLDLGNGEFFAVDTWNNGVQLKRGTGEYNYWTGFDGELVHSCGMQFGGFSYSGTSEQLEDALKRASAHAPEVGA